MSNLDRSQSLLGSSNGNLETMGENELHRSGIVSQEISKGDFEAALKLSNEY